MSKDKCILCGEDSNYDSNVHIDYRIGYIEGAGQLCSVCHKQGEEDAFFKVPKSFVLNNPNDMDLGYKVRSYYRKDK
jgi:hypothetical protein